MKIFLVLFSLYCAGHLYIFIFLLRAFGGGLWLVPALVWLAAMVFPWPRYFGGRMGKAGNILAAIAFAWMGFFIFLLYAFLACDLAAPLARFLAFATGADAIRDLALALHPEHSAPFALGAAALLFVYGLYEARRPRVVHLSLTTPKLAADAPPLRIVGVSDLHLAAFTGPRRLRRMASAIAAQRPDILLVAGDLADADMTRRDEEAAILRAIPAPLGKFAVTGNHEFYRGLEISLAFMRKSGLTVLRGQAAEAGGIIIAGVDDSVFAGRFEPYGEPGSEPGSTDAMRLLAGLPEDRFILLMNHRPHCPEQAVGLFDLQFSGHTHGGQIWPGRHLARKSNGAAQGLTRLQAGQRSSLLFVSNGLGFWGPPVRFLAPPEIVVITLAGENRG